jgi:hypothetical protein
MRRGRNTQFVRAALVSLATVAILAGCSHDGRTLRPPVYPAPPPPTTIPPADSSDILGLG